MSGNGYYKKWLKNKGHRIFADVPKRILFSKHAHPKSETAITDKVVIAQSLWRKYCCSVVNGEVKKGGMPAISSLKCDVCGGDAHYYHHHNGYHENDILSVIPLCRKCHAKTREYHG